MSLLTTEILPFETEAYHEGAFKKVTDADLKGHWSVVFFYPADFTFVCPTELEDLADHYAEFKKLGVEIYAVSTDTHFTHKAWHESSAAVGKVQFPMLGDKTGQISRNFDVLIEKEGLAERAASAATPLSFSARLKRLSTLTLILIRSALPSGVRARKRWFRPSISWARSNLSCGSNLRNKQLRA